MRIRAAADILGSCAIWLATGPAFGGDVGWKKTIIDGKFRSEGVAVADVNKDGKTDVLVGDSWYEAPTWARHAIRTPGDYGDGLNGYSECMICWADDLNRDGWPDQIVIGFPGKPAAWYENPKGVPGLWARHEIAASAWNESPQYADLFGDGRRVLVMGWPVGAKGDDGRMGWLAPGDDPTQPWEGREISAPFPPGRGLPFAQRFAHGLGTGDLNGDGRKDVISTSGWWEQPAEGRAAKGAWPFHPADLGQPAADMIAYDVSGDGKADVIASSAHKFGIWWCEQGDAEGGDAAFRKHDLFPDLISETHALVAADINGDGLTDLVTGKRFWSHGRSEAGSDAPPRLYWLEARRGVTGAIAFVPREVDDRSGIGTQFVLTDFNGDGRLDIVTSNKKGVFLFEQAREAK